MADFQFFIACIFISFWIYQLAKWGCESANSHIDSRLSMIEEKLDDICPKPRMSDEDVYSYLEYTLDDKETVLKTLEENQ